MIPPDELKRGRALIPAMRYKINEICRYLRASRIVRGSRIVLTESGNGTRIDSEAAASSASNPSVDGYDGCFAVSEEGGGMLAVSSGWLLRNGETLEVPATGAIKAQSGWLCVCSTILEGEWTSPNFEIKQAPAPDAYPVAEITVDGENQSISIRQYRVALAIIMLAQKCPRAEF